MWNARHEASGPWRVRNLRPHSTLRLCSLPLPILTLLGRKRGKKHSVCLYCWETKANVRPSEYQHRGMLVKLLSSMNVRWLPLASLQVLKGLVPRCLGLLAPALKWEPAEMLGHCNPPPLWEMCSAPMAGNIT